MEEAARFAQPPPSSGCGNPMRRCLWRFTMDLGDSNILRCCFELRKLLDQVMGEVRGLHRTGVYENDQAHMESEYDGLISIQGQFRLRSKYSTCRSAILEVVVLDPSGGETVCARSTTHPGLLAAGPGRIPLPRPSV